jgi:transcriptional regulator with XRE-family HTH domain
MVKSRRASEILAAQLPVWRERRNGLSAQQLADRIADLGGKLGRVAISEIENGRRGVSLDEALLLAAALNVPPPILFFPLGTGEHVAITPTSVIHPDFASRWLAGVQPLAATDRSAMGLVEWGRANDEWNAAGKPLRLYDDHREAFRKAQEADNHVRRARAVKDPDGERKARYRFIDRLQELVDVRDKMRAEDMSPPWLEPRWSSELQKLGEEG